jgi:UDP-N-acetyl-D-mannosaminuronic acid dehydrogenase
MTVFGMGYVGIPAAALFADSGEFEVTGVQRRSKRSGWKIDYLNEGKNPIKGDEPGLAELIQRVVGKGTFKVSDDPTSCSESDVILIDVQTPVEKDSHAPLYESLKEVSATISKNMKKGALVVIESTVAPGTTDFIVKPILEENSGMKCGQDFYLAFSYERVMVGRLLFNITDLPRIVGGTDARSTEMAMELYGHIVKAERHATTALTAEIAKVTENTYRDVNIAFANEVAMVCEALGVNVYDVRKLVNTLPNIPGDAMRNPIRNMHIPGAGVGGHCLPKDPWLMKYGLDTYGNFEFMPEVIVGSRGINDHMPVHMKELLLKGLEKAGHSLGDSKIAILGLAFMKDSDDTRNSPTFDIVKYIKDDVGELIVHDPLVDEFEDAELTADIDAALSGADAVVIMNNHSQYKEIDLGRMKGLMRTPVIIDGRDIFAAEEALAKGFIYIGLGKG